MPKKPSVKSGDLSLTSAPAFWPMPRSPWPDENLVGRTRTLAKEIGGRLTVTENVDEAVKGA